MTTMATSSDERVNVAAVAGRRIDAVDSKESRFPARFASVVRAEAARVLSEWGAGVLVASAACGADILALEAAVELGIRIRIVLPFARDRFRETSVIDRGEEWGARYDNLLDAAAALGDVIVLESGSGDADAAYARATARIIAEAASLAHDSRGKVLAIAIWDENPRASGDATRDFQEQAEAAGMTLRSILTLREG